MRLRAANNWFLLHGRKGDVVTGHGDLQDGEEVPLNSLTESVEKEAVYSSLIVSLVYF